MSIISKIKRKLKQYTKKLPKNTIDENLTRWSRHNWSQFGEEWSNNPEWKASLIEHVLIPNISENSSILEIGPGGGRITEHLLKRAKNMFLVDLTPKCIELCKERFKDYSNIEYFVNDGKNLDFIPDNSLDRVWSWDVFVHIQSKDIENYIKQFNRIMKPGALGIIHHSKNGKTNTGWRSDMTAKKMQDYCKKYDLKLVNQFETWDNGRYRIWPNLPLKNNPDVISVFSK